MRQLIAILFVFGLVFMQSCGSDDPTCTKAVEAEYLNKVDKDRLAFDITTIDTYLAANGIVAQTEPNGVRYVITQLGTGEKLSCLENRISVKYTGRLLVKPDGEFDSSASPVTFKLTSLILGWQLVLPLIPTGSKVTLYIPSGYGYGVSGGANGKIPSNANLIFEIELVAVS